MKNCGSILVVYGHRYRGDCGICVEEDICARIFTSTNVTIIELSGEVEMYPFDIT